MNWLAHLLLSEPSTEFRMGNILADILRGPELELLPIGIQRGVACHRRIDAFTDAHPIIRRSKQRVSGSFRRYASILVDVYYDHLLATEWHRHSDVSLEQFTSEVYAGIDELPREVPAMARMRLEQMRRENWLGRYHEMEGIRRALEGVGSRLRRPVDLGASVADLEMHYDGFRKDFGEFFPELRRHVEG
jgi:acyl carrier protein phosphodiesterase